MEPFNYLATIILGASIGSFIGATVWRLRARDLKHQKKLNQKIDSHEFSKLSFLNKSISRDRSRCLHCKHQLSFFDLIPIISWVSLRGKCRYCKKPIGSFELYIEIITALYFLLSLIFWPFQLTSGFEIFRFILWLTIGSLLLIIGAYDAKWSEIPSLLMYITIFLSLVWSFIFLSENNFSSDKIISLLFGVLILSGFYLAIYLLSKGKWIGFGDIELGLALALLLCDWRLSFVTLFMANFLGTLIVLPGLLTKKILKTQSMPFGPLYIAGFFIAYFWGSNFINWFVF